MAAHPLHAAASSPANERQDWSALMRRAQDGDRDAYAALLHAIVPYLRHLATRNQIAASDVEDVVQDILLTVHDIRHTYNPIRPFGPWLVAIARRRIIDHLRRGARARAREPDRTVDVETLAAPEANLPEARCSAGSLRAAVAALPAGQRQAIELLKFEELSLAQASARTGLSVSALKVATHRALRALRRRLVNGPSS